MADTYAMTAMQSANTMEMIVNGPEWGKMRCIGALTQVLDDDSHVEDSEVLAYGGSDKGDVPSVDGIAVINESLVLAWAIGSGYTGDKVSRDDGSGDLSL